MHYLLFYDYVENAVEHRAPFREEHRTVVVGPLAPPER
jgi:hypothetical protein